MEAIQWVCSRQLLSHTWSPGCWHQGPPFSRWRTAGLDDCLPDVASRVGKQAILDRGHQFRVARAWCPGQECIWPVWGEVCLNNPASLSLSGITSFPALVGWCFHNRKIKSIRHCSKMSVCCKLASDSSIVSGLRQALRPAALLVMGSRAEREF